MWSIQFPSGKCSYLFGTMHIRDDRVFQLCEQVYPFIQSSDVYISEMDLADPIFTGETPIYSMESQFRPAVYQKIKAQLLKSFRVDISAYDRLHPLLILSALSMQVLQRDHIISMDEHLWKHAVSQQKQTYGLESVQEQMDILHGIDPAPLYKQLKKAARKPDGFRYFTTRTVDTYLQQRIHVLYSHTKSSMHHLRKSLIYERNKIMTERILAMDHEWVHFIAVGAGHLSGQYGLIRLLRQRNCKVTAI